MLEESVRQLAREEIAAALAAIEIPAPPVEWLDSTEAAQHLKIGRAHLHNLVSTGALSRHGGKGQKLMFRRADLDAYVEERHS